MSNKRLMIAVLTVVMLGGGVAVVAADKGQPGLAPANKSGMNAMPMDHGMMGGDMKGMMGMMEMMNRCNDMMKGGMMGMAMPPLPPGNEKLQLQMHAEMMQKMGEITAKYADKIKTEN